MPTNKSLIRNSNQVKQVIDFTGIQNGKIHPSDIDAVLEFNNDALILIEVKRKGNRIPMGQRLLLERINDSWHNQEKAIVLKVVHSFKDDTRDIPLNECTVEVCYYKGKWSERTGPLLEVLNKLGESWNIKKLAF
tara:strand:- start:1481 stop:1885 length:405 start_codon:yes stop_codon:yes gene_type:complete